MSGGPSIRVLIADDSAVSRRVLAGLIDNESDIEVVGSVGDGRRAVDEVVRVTPDLVLMDVLMPVMDGLAATREVMHLAPCRIILVSELVGREQDLNFRALEAGALDLMRKPSSEELREGDARTMLLRKIRTYARVPVVRRHRRGRGAAAAPGDPPMHTRTDRAPTGSVAEPGQRLVCIGASTGGPPAIRCVLEALDGLAGVPVLIAQHMTEGFIEGMAAWLDGHLPALKVSVARDGERPLGGHVYLAPDNAHLRLVDGVLTLTSRLAGLSYRPSVDVLFESVAGSRQARGCVAALLTGMGEDGARGLLALRGAGAHTIAQDEATSTVYGMPRAAREMGAACEDLALSCIGGRIRRLVAGQEHGGRTDTTEPRRRGATVEGNP